MNMLDPHAAQPILRAGTPLERAAGALILLHGRGGSAEDILTLGEALADDRFALLAPQASGHSWYPNSFLAQRDQNEPAGQRTKPHQEEGRDRLQSNRDREVGRTPEQVDGCKRAEDQESSGHDMLRSEM